MLEGAELAEAIYTRQRDADIKHGRVRTRIPRWSELAPTVRGRLIKNAMRCAAQYSRSRAREVPLIP